jgi:hypothetical protein
MLKIFETWVLPIYAKENPAEYEEYRNGPRSKKVDLPGIPTPKISNREAHGAPLLIYDELFKHLKAEKSLQEV